MECRISSNQMEICADEKNNDEECKIQMKKGEEKKNSLNSTLGMNDQEAFGLNLGWKGFESFGLEGICVDYVFYV